MRQGQSEPVAVPPDEAIRRFHRQHRMRLESPFGSERSAFVAAMSG
jgi:hypothetical protein